MDAKMDDVEMVADSILSSPRGSQYGDEVIPAEASGDPHDPPGPSTTYIAPESSAPEPGTSSSARPTRAAPSAPAPAPAPAGPSTSTLTETPASPPLPPLVDLDDEDDEVVATLPVYISPTLINHLALFQYPLQHRSLRVPQWAADRGKRITTRVKEGVGRIEIEVPIDADARVWREERAREIGFVPDASTSNGRREEEDESKAKKKKEKEPRWGDKMRLRSEVVPTKQGTYFSGIVHEGALHLHPISKHLQFRTSLAYLDDYDNKNRPRAVEDEEKKRAAQRKDLPKGLDDPNNDGSGSIKDFRNKMWSLQAREDEDKWVPYEWHEGVEDDNVTESLESLLVHPDRRGMLDCKMRALDYLDRHR